MDFVKPRKRFGPVWTLLRAGGCDRTVGALLELEHMTCGVVSSLQGEKK